MLKHCQRIIREVNSEFWVIENPYNGTMKDYLGKPNFVYQPWEFGSPWTKKTALWGKFNTPEKLFNDWQDVPKIKNLYTRPGRGKPGMYQMHKSAIHFIDEFYKFKGSVYNDSDFRSLCSQGFAKSFYSENK